MKQSLYFQTQPSSEDSKKVVGEIDNSQSECACFMWEIQVFTGMHGSLILPGVTLSTKQKVASEHY